MIRFRATAIFLTLAGLVFLATPPLAAADNFLVQKALPDGCVRSGGVGGCSPAIAVTNPLAVAISPDGENVYSVANISNAIAIFDRNIATGVLTQKAGTAGCISDDGSGGACVDGKGLGSVAGVTVSPDGNHVYVAANIGVLIFARNNTGDLAQLGGTNGCVSDDGSGGDCADGTALVGCNHVVVSPDGENVYLSCSQSDSVVVFDRNTSSGVLSQKAGTAGCISEDGTGGDCADGTALDSAHGIAISPDGTSIYVSTSVSDGVVIIDRNTVTGALTQKAGTAGCITLDGTGGECVVGRALNQSTNVTVSPDGENVYVTSGGSSGGSDAVAVFGRNTSTGALTQLAGTDGCVSASGLGGECAIARGIISPFGIAASADGSNVYTASEDSNGVATFDRDPDTGALTQEACPVACQNDNGTEGCLGGNSLNNSYDIVLSPDGNHAYVAAEASDAIAVFDRNGVPCTTTTTSSTTTTTLLPPPCPITPNSDCHVAPTGRAALRLKNADDPAGNKIEFVWRRGEATALDAFGDPIAGASTVHLCLYDSSASAQPLGSSVVPPGGTCGGKPCWQTAGKRGFRFKDHDAASDGVREVILKAGETALKPPKLYLKAKGAGAQLPALPLTLPVTAQLVVDDGVSKHCWEAVFTEADRNNERTLQAKAP